MVTAIFVRESEYLGHCYRHVPGCVARMLLRFNDSIKASLASTTSVRQVAQIRKTNTEVGEISSQRGIDDMEIFEGTNPDCSRPNIGSCVQHRCPFLVIFFERLDCYYMSGSFDKRNISYL